jgi:ABC-type transport system involved in multi-copper enzyme maturation permease subunit
MLSNPVLFKELRLIMRTGRPFWAMVGYVSVLGVVACIAFPHGPVSPTHSQAGRALFWTLTVFQFILVCLLTPAMAGTTLAVEKEQRTMEMLLLSALTPREIVWGKFLASLLNVSLLVVCSVPLTAMSFMLGGVSPGEVFMAYVGIFLMAATAASISVLSSAEETRTYIALFRSYGSSAALVGVALPVTLCGWLFFPMLMGGFIIARGWRRIKGWSIPLGIIVCIALWFLMYLLKISWTISFVLGIVTCSVLLVYPFLYLSERAVLKPPPPTLSRREQAEQRAQRSQGVNADTMSAPTVATAATPAAPPPARTARRPQRRRRDTSVYATENFIPDGVNPIWAKEMRTSFFGREGLLWKTAAVGLAVGIGGLLALFLLIAFGEWMDSHYSYRPSPFSLSQVHNYFTTGVRWLFAIVGLMYLILVMSLTTAWAALTFAREREQRSLDLMVMTPLGSHEIVRGKFYTVADLAAFLAAISFPSAILCAIVGAVPWWMSLVFIVSQTIYSIASIAMGMLCSLGATSSRRAMAAAIGLLVVGLVGGVSTAMAIGSYQSVSTMFLSAFPLDAFWTAVGWLCRPNPQPHYSEVWLLSMVWYSIGGLLLLWLCGVLFERWFRRSGVT